MDTTDRDRCPAPPPTEGRNSFRRFAKITLSVLIGAILGSLVTFFAMKRWGGTVEVAPEGGHANNKSPGVLPPKVDFMPSGCEPIEGAAVVTDSAGRRAFDRVDRVLPGGTRVRFVLIPQTRPADPPTFYIMEDKVPVALFEKFAVEKPDDVRDKDKRWLQGGRAGGEPTQNKDKRHPVFNVHVEDAWRLARWLGGTLLSGKQWDKAAGEFEANRGHGPYDLTAREDIGIEEPFARGLGTVDRGVEGPAEMAPPGAKVRDRSVFGVRYMAGNGLEFTRGVEANVPVEGFPLSAAIVEQMRRGKGEVFVVCRGHSYQDPDPYQFVDPKIKEHIRLELVPYHEPRDYVTFRVVLEQPKE
jgi:hypothetical protein